MKDETLIVEIPDINYIPGYAIAEQERRSNEEIRISNEEARQDYYEEIQRKVDNGEFDGEQGIQGEPGASNVLTIGTVVKGEEAAATITGTSPNQVLNLVLPKGDKGDTGEQGIQGIPGEQGVPGTDGQDGAKGEQGEPGVGVPTGGTTGQVLAKKSETDYDTEWKDGVDTSQFASKSLYGDLSISIGRKEGTVVGDYSTAIGYNTTASTYGSHAEGISTSATGTQGSHAEGYLTYAIGSTSHAEGYGTTMRKDYGHVQGSYNVIDMNNRYVHIVGVGTSSSNRKNAHTIDSSGNGWFLGDVYVKSSGGREYDSGSKKLATEEFVTNQIGNINTILATLTTVSEVA